MGVMDNRVYTNWCDRCRCKFTSKSSQTKRCPDCRKCKRCGKQLPNAEHNFCSRTCYGKWSYENGHLKENMEMGRSSEAYTPERAANIAKSKTGVARPNMRGENSPWWKGNKSERRTAMERLEYKTWRATVFKRDNFTCAICDKSGIKVEAHHILGWAEVPELRYDVSNGVTLCKPCHEGINGIEEQFQGRFQEHVRDAAPVELTEEELARFSPVYVQCSHCGKDKRISPCHQSKRWHFCDMECKQAYERSIGGDWGRHSKGLK